MRFSIRSDVATVMETDRLLSLLQFADGLFPSGAFAHSFGLETYVSRGVANDALTVEALIRAHLEGAIGTCDTVAMVHALRAAKHGDCAACVEADIIVDAMKVAAELRHASRQMGLQTLRIADALSDNSTVCQFAEAVASGSTPCHHCVVFGLVAGTEGWPEEYAASAFTHSSVVAMVGAALRLLPIGQLEGQRIIRRLQPLVARVSGEAIRRGMAEMSNSALALEIAAMRHERLEARLFRS